MTENLATFGTLAEAVDFARFTDDGPVDRMVYVHRDLPREGREHVQGLGCWCGPVAVPAGGRGWGDGGAGARDVIAFGGGMARKRRDDWWDQPENEVATDCSSEDRVRVVSARVVEDGHHEVAIVSWRYWSPTVELILRDGKLTQIAEPWDAAKGSA